MSITATVGEHGVNKTHDVAVIQAMLRVIKDPKTKHVFLHQNINGLANGATIAAIKAFQTAFATAVVPSPVAAPAPPKPVVFGPVLTNDTFGLIEPGKATHSKIITEAMAVKPAYYRLAAIPDKKFVYIEGTDAEHQAAQVTIANSELQDTFKTRVAANIKKTFETHGIVLKGWNPKTSYRRSYAEQHKAFENGSSGLQPGEGLHSYGVAMDVGFLGLTMILDDGREFTVINEPQFDTLDNHRREALYKLRNDIWESPPKGAGNLYRIRLNGGDNDPNHFQNVNNLQHLYPGVAVVDVRRSLADHLTQVSSLGATVVQWTGLPQHHYACDFGLGVTPVDCGTADEIWSGHPTVTKAQYLHAVNKSRDKAKQPHLNSIPDADFQKVTASLVKAFADAEARWNEYVPKLENGTPA